MKLIQFNFYIFYYMKKSFGDIYDILFCKLLHTSALIS
jgi:hypothetical protein